MGTYVGIAYDSVSVGSNQWASFDIKDMLKDWKNGERNPNAGFILDASTSIVEGGTKTLTATTDTAGETVTWGSSKPSVATVNSSGVVTGIKAGTAIITATRADGSTASCLVYVAVADGVYYIRNANAGMYLTTNGSIADNTTATLQSKATSGLAQVRQLWKIKYIGNGYYVIRAMHKLNMGLSATSNNVNISAVKPVGASDSVDYSTVINNSLNGVAPISRWTITAGAHGYYNLHHTGTSSMSMTYPSGAIYTGMSVITAIYSSTSVSFDWELVSIDTPPSGVILYDTSTYNAITSPTRYVAVGESKTIAELNLLAAAYSGETYNNSQQFTWTLETTTSNASINSSTNTITGLSEGTVTVVGTNTFGSVQFYVTIIPIPDGTYFVRSWHSDKYVDIKDQLMATGTTVYQWEFHGGQTQQWVFTHIGDSVYSIHSANASTTYYLGVSGDSTNNNQPVVLKNGSLTDGMKWRIAATSSGTYKITPITGETNNRVLALYVQPTGYAKLDGDLICQGDYTQDDIYTDEWLLCPVNNTYTLESQQTAVWCWAASARMASSIYMDSPVSQSAAAVYVKVGIRSLLPTAANIDAATFTGSPYETKEALRYITGLDYVYYTSYRIYDETTLRSLLDASTPVIIHRGWYTDAGRDSGHAVVIYGYYWDSELQAYMYQILDPGPMGSGNSYSRSYASICNGNNALSNNDMSDNGVWESVVVFCVGDYRNTVTWPGCN